MPSLRALLCACVLSVCFNVYVVSAAGNYTYGAIIDAGSSGSRFAVYRWTVRDFHSLPPPLTVPEQLPSLLPKAATHVKPGVNTDIGRQRMEAMVVNAGHLIQQNLGVDIRNIPLFLKATAGLRILTAEEREAALSDVRSRLATTGFEFKPEWARVIAGEEEGVYGWLSVNLLENSLHDGADAWAALDFGGASTQITVPPAQTLLSNLFNLQLGDSLNTNLYTHSYLYFGLDQFRHRVNALVAGSPYARVDRSRKHLLEVEPVPAATGAPVPNPCYCPGTPNVGNFTGTGNYDQCATYVRQLLYKNAECLTDPVEPSTDPSTCGLNGVYQPPVASNKFMAFSGIQYLYDALGLPSASSLNDVKQAVSAWCANDLAKNVNASGQSVAYATNYCHAGVYVVTLLTEGYGLSPTRTDQLYVPSLDGLQFSYAQGSMLFEANALPWGFAGAPACSKSRPFKTPTIALGVVAGCLLMATVFCFMKRARRSDVREMKPYDQLGGGEP